MMPSKISTDLASLLPGKHRTALSIHLCFDKTGTRLPEIGIHSVIKNTKAYSYEEVDKIVEKKKYREGVYKLYQFSREIARKNIPTIQTGEWNSHKMVEVLMVITNMCC